MTSDNEQLAYRFARGILRPTLSVLTRRDWRGQQHIPATGGCVLVTNHVSHVDPLTLAHFVNDAGRAPRFLGKAEVFELPVVGRIVAAAGQIPVSRESVDAVKALQAAIEAVRSGECVVLYPEATLTRDRNLWPMMGKTGAARIALLTGCPVIPVAQWGPQHVLAAYHRVPRLIPRRLIHVWAGQLVDLSDFAGREHTADTLRASTSVIMAAIVELLAGIRGESAPAQLFDPKSQQGVPRIGNPSKALRRTQEGR